MKMVINSTEGGAQIKGTTQLSLRETLDKYCTQTVDKSKIEPLLTLAEDGDKLVTKVIPLLKDDIAALDEIALQSKRGIAVGKGLKTLTARSDYQNLLPKKKERLFTKLLKEAGQKARGNYIEANRLFYEQAIQTASNPKLKGILILSGKNFHASEAAHAGAVKNPLVNIAIYGASRTIQGRQLKTKETLIHFLKNPKDAQIRIKRNMLILKAAKDAAEVLKTSYVETLTLLKKYNEIKDRDLLATREPEPVNLDDAEDYFKAGNWAHPLLDARKTTTEESKSLKKNNISSFDILETKAYQILKKAISMRDKAINKAKTDEDENADRRRRLIRYNDLLEQSKRLGRIDGKFNEALEMLKEAAELMPEETEARWGVATALHHAGQISESLKEYEKLVKDFPDTHRFRFEYGQVLLRGNDIPAGLEQIELAMKETEEFSSFLARIGEIYEFINLPKKALEAYTTYLKKYPANFEVWTRKGNCLTALGQKAKAKKAFKKALDINPNYAIAKSRYSSTDNLPG